MAAPPPLPPGESRLQLTRSTIFPLIGTRATLAQEHLLPIVATVVAGVALIAAPFPGLNFSPKAEINEAWQVYGILAVYIAILVNCYINQMCGRPKPGWLNALVAVVTGLLLGSPFWSAWYAVFYYVLPAAQWQKSTHVVVQLAGWWFGTGLCEEGFKAWPLFALALLGAAWSKHSRRKRRIGLYGPLDGIVLGVASGSGFFIRETLGQYVPGAMSSVKYAGSQAFDGLVLLLGRGLPDIAEHSAWCGLFGYFIGLSVLWPNKAIFLIPLGWLSAAALHAGWDGISAVTDNGVIILIFWVFIGVLSYALLAGAIFKAREISPTLDFNIAGGDRPGQPAPAAGHRPPPLPVSDAPDGD